MNKRIIPITNESIRNIPCVKMFNDDEINKIMQQHCIDILLASKNRRDGHANDEVGRLVNIFNKNIKLDIIGKWNNRMQTCIIDTNTFEYEQLIFESSDNTLVFIHNHPDNSEISFSDIMMLLLDTSIRCVIAVGNTEYTYYLIKLVGEDIYKYTKLYNKITNYLRGIQDVNDRIEAEVRIGKKILEDAKSFGLVYGISKRRIYK